jgi:hypothetical protein
MRSVFCVCAYLRCRASLDVSLTRAQLLISYCAFKSINSVNRCIQFNYEADAAQRSDSWCLGKQVGQVGVDNHHSIMSSMVAKIATLLLPKAAVAKRCSFYSWHETVAENSSQQVSAPHHDTYSLTMLRAQLKALNK